VAAHAAGVQAIRANTTHYVSEPFDAVVTSAAGFPLDLTFYQTVKGITAIQKIMKPGGRVLILSECAEGIGSPEFAAKLRTYTAPNEFLEGTRTAPVEVDQWVLEKLALADRQLQLLFFTPGVAADALGSLGSRTFGDVRQAIDALLANLPDGARIGLIPDGPYVHAALVRSHDSDREQTS
jgi:nickel-dependent lactate racemase